MRFRRKRGGLLFVWAGCAVLTGLAKAPTSTGVSLARLTAFSLQKESGQIDQVLALPEGQWVVRDSNATDREKQALEIYGSNGHLLRKLGGFGRGPGQYYRLMDVERGRDASLWVVDISSRLTRFDARGSVLSTQLIQKPGYLVFDLALDEGRNLYYLSGCLPTQTYLDLGCRLLHQYRLPSRDYRRSFLETDPEAVQKHYLALEHYHLDIDRQGRVYLADAPLLKLFRVEPASGAVQTFPVASDVFVAPPSLRPGGGGPSSSAVQESSFLMDRLLVVEPWIVLSIREPHSRGYLLQVFDLQGIQKARDLPAPGHLVGKSASGNLYFSCKGARGFELGEYRIVLENSRQSS